MFEEINDYKIIVHKGDGMNYIPNVISLHPLEQLFKATEWLVDEAVRDWDTTHAEIKQRRATTGISKENSEAYNKLSIRLGSRTQGYINQLCLMEDLLRFEYKRMAELVTQATAGKIIIKPEKDYRKLVDDFKKIRTFRRKVVAHTAYTDSRRDDNPETIVRSILNLFPAKAKHTVGDNFYSGFSPLRSVLPIISIFSWEKEIKPIFEQWKNLFIETLTKIHPVCPFENGEYKIRVGYPHKVFKKTS